MSRTINALLLVLVSKLLFFVGVYPVYVEGAARTNQRPLDDHEVERLRKMSDDSHRAAKDSLYEMNVLKHLVQSFNVPSNTRLLDRNGRPQSDSNEMAVNFDNKDSIDRQYVISGLRVGELPSRNIPYSGTSEIIVEETKNDDKKNNQKPVAPDSLNDARQFSSGLFSGINSIMSKNPLQQSGLSLTGLNNENPLMEGVGNLFQNAPKLPLLTPGAPKAPKAKSSLIDNNGGTSSLNSDSVVVVNVLSYN